MKKCPYCGAIIDDDAQVCPECGKDVDDFTDEEILLVLHELNH